MNLQEEIKINKKIMELIKSKHSDVFPGVYSTPEARYYKILERETAEAEQYLEVST